MCLTKLAVLAAMVHSGGGGSGVASCGKLNMTNSQLCK